jgi:hypothetical protein
VEAGPAFEGLVGGGAGRGRFVDSRQAWHEAGWQLEKPARM